MSIAASPEADKGQQMTSYGAPAQSAAWDNQDRSEAPTIGWFVRRSALWAAIVLAGVISACALYAVATDSGADAMRAIPKAAASPLKV
jgi:hypothetical protein